MQVSGQVHSTAIWTRLKEMHTDHTFSRYTAGWWSGWRKLVATIAAILFNLIAKDSLPVYLTVTIHGMAWHIQIIHASVTATEDELALVIVGWSLRWSIQEICDTRKQLKEHNQRNTIGGTQSKALVDQTDQTTDYSPLRAATATCTGQRLSKRERQPKICKISFKVCKPFRTSLRKFRLRRLGLLINEELPSMLHSIRTILSETSMIPLSHQLLEVRQMAQDWLLVRAFVTSGRRELMNLHSSLPPWAYTYIFMSIATSEVQ